MAEVDERAARKGDAVPFYDANSDSEGEVQTERYEYDESRKLGIMGSAFIILNKMIGTGSECCASIISDWDIADLCSIFYAIGYLCRDGVSGRLLHPLDSRFVLSGPLQTSQPS